MSNIPDTIERGVEKVTTGFAGNPLCLAAVLLSGMFAVLVYFTYTSERAQSHEREMALIRQCLAPDRVTLNTTPETMAREPRFGGPR